jgi:hypothetical protein
MYLKPMLGEQGLRLDKAVATFQLRRRSAYLQTFLFISHVGRTMGVHRPKVSSTT